MCVSYSSLCAYTSFWLCATCLLACQSSAPAPADKEYIEYYGTGQVQRRYTVVNGKKEGKMTDYYTDGRIKGERWFENDLQIAKSVLYYQSGAVQEVQYYGQEGKRHGGDTVFYENGKPQFALQYEDGLKNGYLRKWSEIGTLIFEARYEKDSLVEVRGQLLKKKEADKHI